MKFLPIIACFIFAPLITHAQGLSFQGSIGIKKNILYNSGQLVNTGNTYRFVANPNPYFEIDANYDLPRISLQAGLTLYPTRYWTYYNFHSATAGFNQQFGLGIISVQLPLRVQCKITDKIKIGLGIAIDYHSFNLQSYRDNFYGIDSFDIEWHTNSSEFIDYISLSNQLIASFEPYKHWGMNLIADIDWRRYPFIEVQNVVTRKGKVIKSSTYSGSPKMLYLALGISYRI